MTTAMEVDLKRKYSEEEQDALYDAYFVARETGNDAEAERILAMRPINPRWAKIIAKVMGKKYLLSTFNVTRADEAFGEGWLDEFQETV